MKMNGSQIIDAPRAAVWAGLNDPKILQQCIPGCTAIAATSPTQMKANVVVKMGPVKASFAGEVVLSDLRPPESYRISGKGQGGMAGFATGGSSVTLTEVSPSQTQMDYVVDAQIGGKMAMLGSRLIDSTAQSMAAQFFSKFAALMKAAPAAQARPVPKAAAPKKAAAKKAAKKAVKKVAKKAAKKAAKPRKKG